MPSSIRFISINLQIVRATIVTRVFHRIPIHLLFFDMFPSLINPFKTTMLCVNGIIITGFWVSVNGSSAIDLSNTTGSFPTSLLRNFCGRLFHCSNALASGHS